MSRKKRGRGSVRATRAARAAAAPEDPGARAIAGRVMAALTYRRGWLPHWSWVGDMRAFDRMDADASGYLTVDELTPAVARLPEDARRRLDAEARRLSHGLFRPWPLQLVWALAVPVTGFCWVLAFALLGWRGVAASDALATLGAVEAAALGGALLLHAEGTRRRRKLVAGLARLAPTGAALSAALLALLDVPGWTRGYSPPRLLSGSGSPGDGALDAGEWGAEGLPASRTGLARALDRLPAEGLQAAAAAIDVAQARFRALIWLDGASILAGFGTFTAGFTGMRVATGSVGRSGHVFPPDPAAAAMFWKATAVLGAIAAAGAIATRVLARMARRRLAGGVRALL